MIFQGGRVEWGGLRAPGRFNAHNVIRSLRLGFLIPE